MIQRTQWQALGFGMIFGAGLLLSGMANPANVIGFLDVQHWNPSLALVMVGAIGVAIFPFRLAKHRSHTPTGKRFHLPTSTVIDRKLIIGAMLFGIGWGLAGICPAPALSLFGMGHFKVLYFILPMLFGMFLFHRGQRSPTQTTRHQRSMQ